MTTSAPALEIASCPLCQSPGAGRFTHGDLFCGLEGEFGQNYCAGCNSFFLSPRVPEGEIGRYYPNSYLPYQDDTVPALAYTLAGRFAQPQRRRRLVERFVRNGRILDVGCGNGAFLRTLPSDAWERHAMDIRPNPSLPFPGEFHAGRFDHEKPPLEGLDVITLWHVFEHLYHPQRALDHAFTLLKPGGFLFLAIPDLHCIDRAIFGKYWAGWDPPRHVATYSARALQTLLTAAGFRLRDVFPDATGDLLSLNCDRVLRGWGFRTSLHASLLARALFSPIVFGVGILGLSPAKVYVAQR